MAVNVDKLSGYPVVGAGADQAGAGKTTGYAVVGGGTDQGSVGKTSGYPVIGAGANQGSAGKVTGYAVIVGQLASVGVGKTTGYVIPGVGPAQTGLGKLTGYAILYPTPEKEVISAIYASANELDLLNSSGAETSRKYGTFIPELDRASIKLPAGSGAVASLDYLNITAGNIGIHFVLACDEDGTASEQTFLQADNPETGTTCFNMNWRADGTLSLQLDTDAGDGTPFVSASSLAFTGQKIFDLYVYYDSDITSTKLELYIDRLLVHTVTESGNINYPARFAFHAPDQATAYISQVIVADNLTRSLQSKFLPPQETGTYTDWTNDYDQVLDIIPDDRTYISADVAALAESYPVSNAAGDEYFNYVHVLHHCEDTTDTSYSKNDLLLHGAAEITSNQAKFGSNSLELPTIETSYATLEGVDGLSLEDGEFCIELWAYFDDISTAAVLAGQGLLTGPHWRLKRNADNTVTFLATDTDSGDPYPVELDSTALLNSTSTWYALRIARTANVWYLFVDGTLEANASWDGTVNTLGDNVYLGISPELADQLNGALDEIRFAYGLGRDTTSYTVQTAAWPDLQKISTTPPTGWESVVGLSVNARCRIADFGDFKMLCRSAGTDGLSDFVVASEIFMGRSGFFLTDPATGTGWTYSAIPNIEIGVNSGESDTTPLFYYYAYLS